MRTSFVTSLATVLAVAFAAQLHAQDAAAPAVGTASSPGLQVVDGRIWGSLLSDALVILDGVASDAEAVSAIAADDIEKIEMIRGAAALALYGERAANGVVVVTTAGSVGVSAAAPMPTPGAPGAPANADPGIRVIGRSVVMNNVAPDVVILVDGVVVDREAADEVLDTRTIVSIEVIRGEAATRLYGSRAADGAILITTRD